MKNAKLVAWGLILSIGLSFVTAIFELDEDFYTLAGLGIMVFGVWSSIILFKNAK